MKHLTRYISSYRAATRRYINDNEKRPKLSRTRLRRKLRRGKKAQSVAKGNQTLAQFMSKNNGIYKNANKHHTRKRGNRERNLAPCFLQRRLI